MKKEYEILREHIKGEIYEAINAVRTDKNSSEASLKVCKYCEAMLVVVEKAGLG